jgi:hypothetical protein
MFCLSLCVSIIEIPSNLIYDLLLLIHAEKGYFEKGSRVKTRNQANLPQQIYIQVCHGKGLLCTNI